MSELIERIPPQDIEAEQSVLGALLVSPEAIGKVAELLRPEHFYRQAHATIYQAVCDLAERGEPIDLITVSSLLRSKEELDAVGGYSYLMDLAASIPTAANVEYYARIVEEKGTLRALIAGGTKIVEIAFEQERKLEDTLDQAEQIIFEVSQARRQSQDLTHIKDVLQSTFETIEYRYENQDNVMGHATGFYDLDYMTSGLNPSDLIILAARPAMGKCLTARTLINHPETGERITIEDYVRRQIPVVYGISESGVVRPTEISAWIDSGVKPVFRVRTRLGREVEVTGHHPFLTATGWTPLHDLKVGDRIAVPRVLPTFGTQRVEHDLARLMAYYIAEDGLSGTSPGFTNTDPVIVEDFLGAITRHFPACSIRRDRITYFATLKDYKQNQHVKNPVTTWLRELGLMGKKADAKRFPGCVWLWDQPTLREFMRALFSCDGTLYPMNGRSRIEFTVASEALARDVQHALTRFGVVAKLWRKTERSWRVEITEAESVSRYQAEIGWIGEKAVRQYLAPERVHVNAGHPPQDVWPVVRERLGERAMTMIELARQAGETEARGKFGGYNAHVNRGITRERLARYAAVLGDARLARAASPDLYWDTIDTIEPMGEEQVYDLTVPDGSNFIAADVCVHNTSLALNLLQSVAKINDKPSIIFSLEMGKEQLVQRMICSEAKIDAHRIKTGFLSEGDWPRLTEAIGALAEAPVYIDDTPAITVMEVRGKARRLKALTKKDLGLIVIDYLQLMSGGSSSSDGNRQQEISTISRSLKALARELNVPIVALSQLSRAVESRTDKRPMLSDLRECVTGDTLVCLADGRRVPIAELVDQEPEVLAITREGRVAATQSDKVWPVGVRPTFTVSLASGRTLTATADHRILGSRGWVRLSELQIGDRMALSRVLPEPEPPLEWPDDHVILLGHLIGDGSYLVHQPLRYCTSSEENSQIVSLTAERAFGVKATRHAGRGNWHTVVFSGNGNRWHPAGVNRWLRDLGLFDQRSHQKRIPQAAFQLPNRQIALLLRHLWATDGSISVPRSRRGSVRVFFGTNSQGLARDVAALLLRLGIVARLRTVKQGRHKPMFTVDVSGVDAQKRFLKVVGAFGPREPQAALALPLIEQRQSNSNVDTLPREVFDRIRAVMAERGVSHRKMAASRGTSYGGSSHFRFAPSRAMVAEYATLLAEPTLLAEATNDLFWDRVVSIVPAGDQPVFDLTVPGPESWLADGVVSHNSGAIEQDADIVMFIYRDDYYHAESPEKNIAEVIIAKHRNGPVGKVKLYFEKEHTRFENLKTAPI